MSFTESQKKNLESFLTSINKKLQRSLEPEQCINFLDSVLDRNLSENDFAFKIASIFRDCPEKLKDMFETIRDLSIVRKTILETDGENAEEARKTIEDNFASYIEKYNLIIKKAENERSEHDLDNENAKKKTQKKIDDLKRLRQQLFDQEKEERVSRKQRKKEEESEIQQQRQSEHDAFILQMKKKKEQLDKEIENLQKSLQENFEREKKERKEVKRNKEIEQAKKRDQQEKERDAQALMRKEKKEKEENLIKARQNKLKKSQEKEVKLRKIRKKLRTDGIRL